MTVGFPDWGRQTVQSGPTAFRVSQRVNVFYNGDITFFGFFPYVNIELDFSTAADIYQISVGWYEDKAGAFPTSVQYITMGPATRGSIQLPALGLWFSLGIAPLAGTDVNTVTVALIASNGYAPSLTAVSSPNGLLVNGSSNVAAGGTFALASSYVAFGEASLYMDMSGGKPWYGTMSYLDFLSGSYIQFISIASSGGMLYDLRTVKIPAAPVRLVLHNQDTVAHNGDMSLIMAP